MISDHALLEESTAWCQSDKGIPPQLSISNYDYDDSVHFKCNTLSDIMYI